MRRKGREEQEESRRRARRKQEESAQKGWGGDGVIDNEGQQKGQSEKKVTWFEID